MGLKSGRGLNENLARELIELHTMGAGSGYSQKDVRAAAYLLTGLWYRAPVYETAFRPRSSEPGTYRVLGRDYGGKRRDIEQVHALLDDLAARKETRRHICRKLVDMGIYQLSLGDTIGVGTPRQTEQILEALLKYIPVEKLALHLHDTRGTALANSLVGLSAGVTTFDASIGGLGGCPYAPGAAGNLATEDAVFMFHGMGVETGINLDKLVEAGELAQELIGRKLAGKFLQAALGEREKRAQRRAKV